MRVLLERQFGEGFAKERRHRAMDLLVIPQIGWTLTLPDGFRRIVADIELEPTQVVVRFDLESPERITKAEEDGWAPQPT